MQQGRPTQNLFNLICLQMTNKMPANLRRQLSTFLCQLLNLVLRQPSQTQSLTGLPAGRRPAAINRFRNCQQLNSGRCINAALLSQGNFRLNFTQNFCKSLRLLRGWQTHFFGLPNIRHFAKK
jgi:hypothetical protein